MARPDASQGGLQPDDVRLAASLSVDALAPLAEADWTRPAHGLEWDCRRTLEHVVYALDRYSLHLATPSQESAPRLQQRRPELANSEVLTVMQLRAGILAAVATAADPAARGYHAWGRPDRSGYLAMGCAEILLHTDDIARGLGAAFQPPDDLCRRVVMRLFPWAPADVDGWSALCWATGRLALPERGRVGADWAWHASPVDEWDGTIRTQASYGR